MLKDIASKDEFSTAKGAELWSKQVFWLNNRIEEEVGTNRLFDGNGEAKNSTITATF